MADVNLIHAGAIVVVVIGYILAIGWIAYAHARRRE